MRLFLLSFFVAAAFAAPTPLDEETGEPVELIVNGVPEGEALEIGELVGIKVKEHVDGVIVASSDLLHPLTAVGMEEIAAAKPQPEIPEIPVSPPFDGPVVVVPKPELAPPLEELPIPELDVLLEPESIIKPEPESPVWPQPESPIWPQPESPVWPQPESPVWPQPESPVWPQPESPVWPQPESPVWPQPESPVWTEPELPVLPEPEPSAQPEAENFPNGEIFNNGVVQVSLNSEPGVLSTVQNWFSMVLNYFNGADVSSQQIV